MAFRTFFFGPSGVVLHKTRMLAGMAAWSSAATIKFTVRRQPAVLVAPASTTPRELKRLSDFDDQGGQRIQVPSIHFYRRRQKESSMDSMMLGGTARGSKDDPDPDPAVVIRDAIARALVPYYPFAGRLREHDDGGKLAVDCTAEGVLFVEADADVRLDQFGDALLPPFPCVEELIFDIPGSSAILHTPLLLIQVTRLACGGFVLALRLNHTMADAMGLMQFLGAVSELARGDAQAPTVRPVWERHLLEGRRNPPPQRRDNGLDFCYGDEVTEDDNNKDNGGGSIMLPSSSSLANSHDMALQSFFFGPGEIAAIRDQLSPELQKRASRFDVIAGWLWKCRTMALAPDLDSNDEPMLMFIAVNARGRKVGPGSAGIPAGYYGNAVACPAAVSTARELCANPVSYAVGLVKETKDKVDMEYMRSVADLIVLRGRRSRCITAGMFCLTDETKVRFEDLDFGWGRPVYGGPATAMPAPALPWFSSFILPSRNRNAASGYVVPVCLRRPAMLRLADEMGKLRRRH